MTPAGAQKTRGSLALRVIQLIEAVQGAKNARFLRGEQVNKVSLSNPAKDIVLIHLSGTWTKADKKPDNDEIIRALNAGPPLNRVQFDTSSLAEWDSSLLTFLVDIEKICSKNNLIFEADGLPHGAQQLLKLASAVPEREGARRGPGKRSFFEMTGGKDTWARLFREERCSVSWGTPLSHLRSF